MHFHRGVDLARRPVRPLADDVGLGKSLLHVAARVAEHFADPVAPFVDGRRPRFERFRRVDDEWQRLVLDNDRACGLACFVNGLGGDRRHLFAS